MPWSDRDIELSVISDFIGVWRRLFELAGTTQQDFPDDLQDAASGSPRDVSSSLTRLVPMIATFHPDVIDTMQRRLQGLADFVDRLGDGEMAEPVEATDVRPSSGVHRVVVVDESQSVARGLELLLRYVSSEQVQVTASSADPTETVALILRHRPDVVVLRLHDLEQARTLVTDVRERFDTHVVLLLDPEDVGAAWEMVHLGATAVVPSSTSAAGLLGPVLACDAGLRVVPGGAADSAGRLLGERDRRFGELSEDDLALWRSVAAGRSDQQIASDLHISARTAKRRVAALLRRVGASNRINAAALAGRHGILD